MDSQIPTPVPFVAGCRGRLRPSDIGRRRLHGRHHGLLAVAFTVLAACGSAHATSLDSASVRSANTTTSRAAANETAQTITGPPAINPPATDPALTPTADATGTTLATVATTTTRAPDPMAARCLACPSVQPDPAVPTIRRGAEKPAPVVSFVKTNDPVVFITIDDGEVASEDAAALLELARVPVTLFLTERYVADKYPYMRRLVAAGGWVEDHTNSHPDFGRVPASAAEICGPLDRFETEFGRRSTLFRPPYGTSTPGVQQLVGSCGMHGVVLWRASMNYGALATQGGDLRAGDIVLMHFRPDLADNLLELFRVANDSGLRIGRLECYIGGDPRCGQPWR